MKKEVGITSLKSPETWEELSTTCNLKVMSRCLSAPDATSLRHCLNNKQLATTNMALIVRIQVFSNNAQYSVTNTSR